MSSSPNIVPTTQLGDRLPEHGRIRMGVKTAKAMRALDTFRFTSPDMEAIVHLAQLYGGQARPWADPKAVPQNQWEVITASKEIEVWLPPNAVTVWYEMWAGGGCVRRCDGSTCQLRIAGSEEGLAEVGCLCREENLRQCKPYTRLKVLLPGVPSFAGVWRLETKGWNAANELPAIDKLLDSFQSVGLVPAKLCIEQRQSEGGSKKFVVPKLVLGQSLEEVALGRLRTAGELAATSVAHMALGVGNVAVDGDQEPDDIEDAELVEDDTPPPLVRQSVLIGQLIEQADKVAESNPRLKATGEIILSSLLMRVGVAPSTKLVDLPQVQLQRCIDALTKVLRGETMIESVTPETIKIVRRK